MKTYQILSTIRYKGKDLKAGHVVLEDGMAQELLKSGHIIGPIVMHEPASIKAAEESTLVESEAVVEKKTRVRK